MSEIHTKKNVAKKIPFPMIDSANPESFKTGLSPTDTAYYDDGAGWNTLAITDTASEVGTTGQYSIDLTAAEMNHDLIMIKLTATGAADTSVIIKTQTSDIDDNNRIVRNIAGFVRHGDGVSYVTGVPYYWDPDSGNDTNDGLTPETARLTFDETLALCTEYNHDSVNLINTTAAPLVVDTTVDISKAKVHLIGDGNTTIKPTSAGSSTVTLSALGTHVEGLNIETHTTGQDVSIEVTADADEFEIHNINIPFSRGPGISVNGASDGILHNFKMRNPGSGGNGHGIQFANGATLNRMHDFDICDAAGDGVNFFGAGTTDNMISAGDGTSIVHGGGAWGVNEQGGADGNEIVGGANLLISHNTNGSWNVGPNTTVLNVTQYTSVMLSGAATGAGAANNQMVIDGDASTTDMIYVPGKLCITGGTGAGQGRAILAYDGATKTITVNLDWVVTPDNTSKYTIACNPNGTHFTSGLVVSATPTTVKLASHASPTDDLYNEELIKICSGLGGQQARTIIDYDGDTQTVTVDAAWTINPDTTSAYCISPSRVDITPEEVNAEVDTAIQDALPSGETEIAAAGAIAKNLDDIEVAGGDITGTDMGVF